MEDEADVQAIVIDNGSYMIKAGFAGDDAPRAVFPAIVGTPKHVPHVVGSKFKDTYVGDEARAKKEILKLRSPVEFPDDPNWDDVEKIWHHVFYNELRVAPEAYNVLLTEKPLTPARCRQRMVQIMMETFKVEGLSIVTDARLSLIASGRLTGVVLDSGYTDTFVVPIQDDQVIQGAVKKLNHAGKHVTNCLCVLLNKRGYNIATSAERWHVNEMKQTFCYVAEDFDAEETLLKNTTEYDKSYTFPDGRSVTIRNERFRCTEAMFTPSLESDKSTHDILYDSVMSCGDASRNLFENIVLSGSNTMFPGYKNRLERELRRLVPKEWKIKATAPPERKLITWIGGSILASLDADKGAHWVSKQQYEEEGPRIFNKPAT